MTDIENNPEGMSPPTSTDQQHTNGHHHAASTDPPSRTSSGATSSSEVRLPLRERDPKQKVSSTTTRSSSPSSLLRSSILKISAEKKARKVLFYRNGDRFHKGLVLAVTPDKYRTFESLLADLTRALVNGPNLPSGVRAIYTMEGRRVGNINDLEHGNGYVCCGIESFKRMEYGKVETPHWGTRPAAATPSVSSNVTPGTVATDMLPKDFIRPKLITVIRNGVRPRKAVRLLLNKKTAPSFEQVLAGITEAIKLDTGAVRKVFTLDGRLMTCLQDFFGEEEIFMAYGPEKYSYDDCDLDSEEYKNIHPYSKSPLSLRKYFKGVVTSPRAVRRRLVSPGCNVNGEAPKYPKKSRPKMPAKSKKAQKNGAPAAPRQNRPPSCPCDVSDKYEIGRAIGDGNFAVVYECVNKRTKKSYALKIIDKSKCIGKEQMIENEVSILRRVKHQHIVRLYEEYNFDDNLYLVMELVKGGDLFDAIATASKYTERDACIMLHDLASALQYLHNRWIVHRDIKPENLLVVDKPDGTKSLKLGDFGLAMEVREKLYTVCGTPTYVAPEILAEVGYGLKVDIWAAGVILYILLCGFPPFASATSDQEELFEKILDGQFDFPSPYWDDVSESAKELIALMLQIDPEVRFSAEDVLDHAWISEDEALDPDDMHFQISKKLGLHFNTQPSSHKTAGMSLIAVSR